MREILTELIAALEAGRPMVLCSLVETRGSTPQKAGAAMLVFPDGSQRGTLGGGCVEAEVKQRALRIPDAAPQLLTFHLDDNYGWDDGLICGGRMTVLAQRVESQESAVRGQEAGGRGQESAVSDYFRRFHELVYSGLGCTEAVAIRELSVGPPGARFLYDAEAKPVATLHAGGFSGERDSQVIPLEARPRAYHVDGVAYLPVLPRITLWIVGGGHVGLAVGKLAAETDFDVCVLDDREQFASRERFPQAQRLVVGEIGKELAALAPALKPSDYAIIVTRGHAHDEEALYHLATTQAGYVGLIGSKRKIRLIFDDLVAKGIPREALERVHAPLGLDIGSQTVPEIAVSIVAELIACRNQPSAVGQALSAKTVRPASSCG